MAFKKHIPIFFILTLVITSFGSSCSTGYKERQLEQKRRLEAQKKLTNQSVVTLNSMIQNRVKDRVVEKFILDVTKKLMQGSSVFSEDRIRLTLITSQKKIWHNYALPGISLYLSTDLLKKAKFDNVLAAVIAKELSHIYKKDLIKNLNQKSDEASIKKAVNYSYEQNLEAMLFTIQLLYRAGYDPRGAITFLEVFLEHPKHSPYSKQEIQKLKQKVREELFQLSPLRNPIVRSTEFVDIYKRIQKL